MERGGFVNRTDYLAFCRGIPGTVVDQPFQDDFVSTIARHADTGKWFAAILRHDGRDFVNLKCDPVEADFLRGAYAGITPAYPYEQDPTGSPSTLIPTFRTNCSAR